jgi:hypothetical protein
MVMISDYMNDVEYKNPFSYLKPWELNPYEKANGKNIYITKRYYTSKVTGERYVQNYQVRKKDKGSFGTYKDNRVAELVRDLLVDCDWSRDKYPMIREFAEYTIKLIDNCWRCKV